MASAPLGTVASSAPSAAASAPLGTAASAAASAPLGTAASSADSAPLGVAGAPGAQAGTLGAALAALGLECVPLTSMRLSQAPWADGTVVLYADGGAAGNGTAGCRAGWGVAARAAGAEAAWAAWPGTGPPPPTLWAAAGPVAAGPVPASNNRGELSAVMAALAWVEWAAPASAAVVTDSEYAVNTLETWLPRWRRKGALAGKANLDLLTKCEALLARARARRPVALRHVRGHGRHPGADPAAAADRAGNHLADRLAAAGQPPAG